MSVRSAEFVRGAHGRRDMVRDDRPQVAFVGRSNVGKSSLLNRIVGRKALARTSSKPGRTRAVNYFLIDERTYLVDLPGYGYARVSRQEREQWGDLVEAYLESVRGDLHIVLLIDAKIDGSPLDRQAIEYFSDSIGRVTVAVTKIDRVPRNKRRQKLKSVREFLNLSADFPVYPVSAKTGEGISELRSHVGLG